MFLTIICLIGFIEKIFSDVIDNYLEGKARLVDGKLVVLDETITDLRYNVSKFEEVVLFVFPGINSSELIEKADVVKKTYSCPLDEKLCGNPKCNALLNILLELYYEKEDKFINEFKNRFKNKVKNIDKKSRKFLHLVNDYEPTEQQVEIMIDHLKLSNESSAQLQPECRCCRSKENTLLHKVFNPKISAKLLIKSMISTGFSQDQIKVMTKTLFLKELISDLNFVCIDAIQLIKEAIKKGNVFLENNKEGLLFISFSPIHVNYDYHFTTTIIKYRFSESIELEEVELFKYPMWPELYFQNDYLNVLRVLGKVDHLKKYSF